MSTLTQFAGGKTKAQATPDGDASTRTRDRILAASLGLFNADGIERVSLGRIASELGMSQGNLHYHFRRKQDIVERLVRRFEQDIEPLLAGPVGDLCSVDDLWLFLHLAFEKMCNYRFIYRDIEFLCLELPAVAVKLRQLTARGQETTRRLCGQLAAAGRLDAGAEEIEVLATQMILTITCWFTFVRFLPETEDVGPGRAAYQVLSLLTPHLAEDERVYVEYLRKKYRA